MKHTARLRRLAPLAIPMLAGALCLACGEAEPTTTTGAPMGGSSEASSTPPSDSNAPPKIASVHLQPTRPRPGEQVRAQVDLAGSGAPRPELEYEWFVNGRRADATGSSLRIDGRAGKGSQIEVSVVAVRGEQRSEPVRARTRIGNLPPVLHGVLIEPAGQISAKHDIAATPQATDDDGDDLRFEYRWEVNGARASAEGSVLPTSFFKRGDEITVSVMASDGQDESNWIHSKAVRVANSEPRIVSTPGTFDELGRFIYPVKVEDPDGDTTFRYRLTRAPAGMEIDVVDGTVSWTPTEDQAGRHPVAIEVSDMNGGTATQTFVVQLDFENPSQPSSPPASAEGSG